MDATPADTFRALAEALRARLAVIADREAYARDPAAHLRQLQEVSGSIDTLQRQLSQPLDARLAHYLERHSYDKALAWLEDALAGKSERTASQDSHY